MTGTIDPAKARDDAGVPQERMCGNCQFSRLTNPQSRQAACLLNPPVVHIMVAQQNKLDPKSFAQVPANTRPTVEATDVCSHHKFTDELSDAEMLAEELSDMAKWLREGIATAK